MNWINLNIATLNSAEFVGSDPEQRATWLCLLAYCCLQENGGRIVGCREWKDRRWQQLIRVTAREISADCELWTWDGDDLVVAFYPEEREAEVQQMRSIGSSKSQRKAEAARENGKHGGRPKNPTKPNEKPNEEEPNSTQREPIERKGKEEKGIGKEENESALWVRPDDWPTLETVQAHAKSQMTTGITPECAESFWNDCESAGWTNRNGHPIRDWRPLLANYARRWNDRERIKPPPNGTPKHRAGEYPEPPIQIPML